MEDTDMRDLWLTSASSSSNKETGVKIRLIMKEAEIRNLVQNLLQRIVS